MLGQGVIHRAREHYADRICFLIFPGLFLVAHVLESVFLFLPLLYVQSKLGAHCRANLMQLCDRYVPIAKGWLIYNVWIFRSVVLFIYHVYKGTI